MTRLDARTLFHWQIVLAPLLYVPYLVQWVESVYGVVRPAVGVKPTAIGLRQLLFSSLFTLLFIITWG